MAEATNRRRRLILDYLENHYRSGRTTKQIAAYVAEELEVPSVLRAIQRDMKMFEKTGFVLKEEGLWHRLNEEGLEFSLKPSEVWSLLFAHRVMAPLRHTEIGEALQSIREQLITRLGEEGREEVERAAQVHLASSFAPDDYAKKGEVISVLTRALEHNYPVRMMYKKPNVGVEERLVEPRATWYHNGRLYLIAWCRSRESYRTFLIQRIETIEPLKDDAPVKPDKLFDLSHFVSSSFGVYQDDAVRLVRIDFLPEVAHLVRERSYHPSQEEVENDDGSVTIQMKTAGLREIAAWVVSFGGRAVARQPPELVDQVRAFLQAGLLAHEDQKGSSDR